jgi:hypothetical protein
MMPVNSFSVCGMPLVNDLSLYADPNEYFLRLTLNISAVFEIDFHFFSFLLHLSTKDNA